MIFPLQMKSKNKNLKNHMNFLKPLKFYIYDLDSVNIVSHHHICRFICMRNLNTSRKKKLGFQVSHLNLGTNVSFNCQDYNVGLSVECFIACVKQL